MTVDEAGEFIENMRHKGWYVRLELFPEPDMPPGDQDYYGCTIVGPDKDDGRHFAFAPSLEQAILEVAEQVKQIDSV